MDLSRIRSNIDDLDSMIITLMAKRADFVRAAGILKKDERAIRDRKRTEQVIEKVRAQAMTKGLDPDIAEKVYRAIISCPVEKEVKESRRTIGSGGESCR